MIDWTQLEQQFLGNSIMTWIYAGVSIFLCLGAMIAAKRLLIRHFRRIAPAEGLSISGILHDTLKRTRFVFFFVVSLYFTTDILVLPARLASTIHSLSVIALILQFGFLLSYFLRIAVRLYFKPDKDGEVSNGATLVAILLRVVLWVAIVLLVLDNLGVNITTLIAGLGVGGVAIGLATQNILSDLFSSLSIILDKPFAVGDAIGVDGFTGTVEKIGLKSTRVRSVSGEQLIFSNADLLKSRVRNFQGLKERRNVVTLGVAYETATEKLAALPAILKEAVESVPLVRFERATFLAFADSALNFELVYFVQVTEPAVYNEKVATVHLAVHRAFCVNGLVFAYPTRTVYVAQPSSDAQKTPREAKA